MIKSCILTLYILSICSYQNPSQLLSIDEIKRTREKRKITNKMGSKAVVSVYLIISLCAAIFVTRGVAQMQNPQAIPGLFPPGLVPIDLVKCWSSLFTVQGCVLAISNSFFSGKIENVEAACCKVFSTLDANCWPHMFPLNPFFPPLLKDNCARIIPNSPAHNWKEQWLFIYSFRLVY